LNENALYELAVSDDITWLRTVVESHARVKQFNNQTLHEIADSTLESTAETLSKLSLGKYTVKTDDLSVYILPLIKHAKRSYHATQYMLPERFWTQYWAKNYMDLNIDAVKYRKVDVTRIFILSDDQTAKEKDILEALMKQHNDNGITCRIVRKEDFPDADDLKDFVIADDEIEGTLVASASGGQENSVEFSINPQDVQTTKLLWQDLYDNSMTYADWKANYYRQWRMTSSSEGRLAGTRAPSPRGSHAGRDHANAGGTGTQRGRIRMHRRAPAAPDTRTQAELRPR
jgi:hypothetical protein